MKKPPTENLRRRRQRLRLELRTSTVELRTSTVELSRTAESIYPITALSFRVAKTMPECPHEYVVRTPENEAAYVALFNLIVEQGRQSFAQTAQPLLLEFSSRKPHPAEPGSVFPRLSPKRLSLPSWTET